MTTTSVTRALFDTEHKRLSFKDIHVDELEASIARLEATRGIGFYTLDHNPDGMSAESLAFLTNSVEELLRKDLESAIVDHIRASAHSAQPAHRFNFVLNNHDATFLDTGHALKPVFAVINDRFFHSLHSRGPSLCADVVVELTTPATKSVADFIVEIKRTLAALRDTYRPKTKALETYSCAASDAPLTTEEIRRNLLDRGWPSSKRVGEMLGSSSETNPAQHAARLRKKGELFGVWSVKDNTFLHPDFQFVDGQLSPYVKPLLAELARQRAFSTEEDPSGWRRAFWLYGAKEALSECAVSPTGTGTSTESRAPAQVFQTAPRTVIDLARLEAEAEAAPNANW